MIEDVHAERESSHDLTSLTNSLFTKPWIGFFILSQGLVEHDTLNKRTKDSDQRLIIGF